MLQPILHVSLVEIIIIVDVQAAESVRLVVLEPTLDEAVAAEFNTPTLSHAVT